MRLRFRLRITRLHFALIGVASPSDETVRNHICNSAHCSIGCIADCNAWYRIDTLKRRYASSGTAGIGLVLLVEINEASTKAQARYRSFNRSRICRPIAINVSKGHKRILKIKQPGRAACESICTFNTERIKPDYRFCKLIFWFNVGALARPEVKPKTPLAQRLREIRRYIGDPDREVFAEQVGVSKNTLASYERGETEPTASVLDAYSRTFGVDIRWVVSGDGGMFSEKPPEISAKHINEAKLSAAAIKQEIFSSVGCMVADIYEAAPEIPAYKDILVVSANTYNRLIERADDPTDVDELRALLPWLKRQLEKSLDKDCSS